MSLALGIDLGTTRSCAAVLRDDYLEIIEIDGERTIPSWVYFEEDGIKAVGNKAILLSLSKPQNCIYDVKRFIGRKYSDIKELKNQWPFTVLEGESGECEIVVSVKGKQKKLKPEEVSAMILHEIKLQSSNILNQEIVEAVITVPAYYSHAQKQATKDAARIAGLKVLKLISEPSAAAFAFLQDQDIEKKRKILVYDLGGGTFDVSLIEFDGKLAQVLNVDGDSNLGGRDFDETLVTYVKEQIRYNYHFDYEQLSDQNKRRATKRLVSVCENAKIQLSTLPKATINIPNFHGIEVELSIARKTFEDMNMKFFHETIEIIKKVLATAKVEKSDIDDVIMVGGSSRIPRVMDMVSAFFDNKKLDHRINKDEAVAMGAALQAATLKTLDNLLKEPATKIKGRKEHRQTVREIAEVVSHTLGIQITVTNPLGHDMDPLIHRNARIPTSNQKKYITTEDGQQGVSINVYEGEEHYAKKNRLIGKFAIEGITPKPKGTVEVIVNLAVDNDGILEVTAEETSKGLRKKLKVNLSSSRMTKEEIGTSTLLVASNKLEI